MVYNRIVLVHPWLNMLGSGGVTISLLTNHPSTIYVEDITPAGVATYFDPARVVPRVACGTLYGKAHVLLQLGGMTRIERPDF